MAIGSHLIPSPRTSELGLRAKHTVNVMADTGIDPMMQHMYGRIPLSMATLGDQDKELILEATILLDK